MKIEKKINIVVISLIIILIIGVLFLVIYQKNKYSDIYFRYNGFDIHKMDTKNGVFYYIKLFLEGSNQPLIISTKNDPRTLENISIKDNFKEIKEAIMKNNLYVSFDKDTTGVSIIAGIEISKITGNRVLYNIPTYGAMIEEINEKNITVKNCEDVNDKTGVIWLKLGNETKIYNNNGCIIIEGTSEYELIRGADRFILTLLGIMKP